MYLLQFGTAITYVSLSIRTLITYVLPTYLNSFKIILETFNLQFAF